MLTQYVVDKIEQIRNFEFSNRHSALSLLQDAAQTAKTNQDRDTLKIISGALSMSYSKDTNGYVPMFVMSNGTRSFSMEDINQEALSILKDTLDLPLPSWAYAQLGDILWLSYHKGQYGEIAVSSYLKRFYETFDAKNWTNCYSAIHRAFEIAIRQGKESNSFKQVCQTINQTLRELDGNDPLFLSLNLIQLVYKHAGKEEINDYLQYANKIFSTHIDELNDNFYIVEEAFRIQESLLKSLNRECEVPGAKEKLANFYECLAHHFKENGGADVYRAIDILKKACKLYNKSSNREKLLYLRKQIEELQQTARNLMPSVPFELDVTKIYDTVDKLFQKLTLQEMIVQLGRIATIYQKDAIRKKVLDEQKTFIFKSMFGSCITDKDNRAIEFIPPLDFQNPEADEELLYRHMVQYVTERRAIGESISLGHAWNIFKNTGTLSIEDLNFLTENNPIIPAGRTDIVKTGIYMGLAGELYAAMHILLPQTEHIFRNLVSMCGDIVTFLKEDGKEEYKPLTQLFQSEKLKECYDEDIIFTFRSIMDDKAGLNLRNLNAHGLLEPEMGSNGIALSFLCLLIKLVSLYSKEAIRISKKLSEYDP